MSAVKGREEAARCESCGAHADVRLRDGSTWCDACNLSAIRLGYDNDRGRPIGTLYTLPTRTYCALVGFVAGFGLGALYMSWAIG